MRKDFAASYYRAQVNYTFVIVIPTNSYDAMRDHVN